MTTLVIGAGLAGLTAALMVKERGENVTVLTRGVGSLPVSDGIVGVYDSPTPLHAIEHLPECHPYRKTGRKALASAVAAFSEQVLLEGSLENAALLPSALGGLRYGSFYSPSYAAGVCEQRNEVIVEGQAPYVLVGFSGFKDFYPALATGNLTRRGLEVRSATLSFGVAGGESAVHFARHCDKPGVAEELGRKLGALALGGERVGIPAVLRAGAFERCREAADVPLFQIPVAPPSVVGLEWNDALLQACRDSRIDIRLNARVVGARTSGGRIVALRTEIAGTTADIECENVIYAGGGLYSGAIERDSYGRLSETVFGLPVYTSEGLADGSDVVNPDFWGDTQLLFTCGLAVNDRMQPLGVDGEAVWSNLYAAGSMLAGAHRAREQSGEGIALASAAAAADSIVDCKEGL